MKIKLDENLPLRLATGMVALGHDVDTVHEERLTGRADIVIWDAAQKGSRFLITQDMDFSDSRKFASGSHHGVLLVRLRSPSRRDLERRILELFQTEHVSDWVGCFVVATERKIRVLKPARSVTAAHRPQPAKKAPKRPRMRQTKRPPAPKFRVSTATLDNRSCD
jgi:predicted nuclease of predicted toxin-antitoxin system